MLSVNKQEAKLSLG